jgi:hypothetical protein
VALLVVGVLLVVGALVAARRGTFAPDAERAGVHTGPPRLAIGLAAAVAVVVAVGVVGVGAV